MINYHYIDNMAFMKELPDNFYDLAIADPEQGKEQHGGKQYTGHQTQSNGSKTMVKGPSYKNRGWDNSPATPEYFKELFRVSKHQIIWGCQYYHENFGLGRIVWDKVNDGSDQYDCELAYTSLNDRTTLLRFMWRGMMQGKNINEGHLQQGNKKLNDKRIHPTQKPVALYEWQFKKFDIPLDWKIFDPNLGSGSHGVACLNMGYSLDGCENDKYMFDLAMSWLDKEKSDKKLKKSQKKLFS